MAVGLSECRAGRILRTQLWRICPPRMLGGPEKHITDRSGLLPAQSLRPVLRSLDHADLEPEGKPPAPGSITRATRLPASIILSTHKRQAHTKAPSPTVRQESDDTYG